MPIELHEENGGSLTVVRLTGTLQNSDYTHLASEFERLSALHGKLRVLLDMTGFHGWTPAALWDEITFDIRHLSKIERLAAVGNREWEHGLIAFSKPFLNAEIRYFDQTEAAAARSWLELSN